MTKKQVIINTNNNLALCDISFWEISMLIKKRRLDVDGSAKEAFIAAGEQCVIASVNGNIMLVKETSP